ncbi:MAG TPA: hypothetical protein ACFYEM_04140 [Candidatus Hypogeohydataceae bacterium YC40]
MKISFVQIVKVKTLRFQKFGRVTDMALIRFFWHAESAFASFVEIYLRTKTVMATERAMMNTKRAEVKPC